MIKYICDVCGKEYSYKLEQVEYIIPNEEEEQSKVDLGLTTGIRNTGLCADLCPTCKNILRFRIRRLVYDFINGNNKEEKL